MNFESSTILILNRRLETMIAKSSINLLIYHYICTHTITLLKTLTWTHTDQLNSSDQIILEVIIKISHSEKSHCHQVFQLARLVLIAFASAATSRIVSVLFSIELISQVRSDRVLNNSKCREKKSNLKSVKKAYLQSHSWDHFSDLREDHSQDHS